MSDDETNTEKSEPLTTGEKKAMGFLVVLRTIAALIIDAALFLVFVYNLYLVLTHDFNIATVSFGVVAFFYLLADAVNQGFKRALSGITASVSTRPGDTD